MTCLGPTTRHGYSATPGFVGCRFHHRSLHHLLETVWTNALVLFTSSNFCNLSVGYTSTLFHFIRFTSRVNKIHYFVKPNKKKGIETKENVTIVILWLTVRPGSSQVIENVLFSMFRLKRNTTNYKENYLKD